MTCLIGTLSLSRKLMKKLLSSFVLALLFTVNAYAQTGLNWGTVVTSLNAVSSTGSGNSYATNRTYTSIITWTTILTGSPSAVNFTLDGSLDNSSWFTLDTSTNTSGEIRQLAVSANFVRITLVSKTGGTTFTAKLTATQSGNSTALLTGNNTWTGTNTFSGTVNLTTVNISGVLTSSLTTDSSSSITGAVKLAGGLGVAKKLYVGTGLFANDGTAAAPSIAFASDTAKGFYSSGTNQVSLALAGTEYIRFSLNNEFRGFVATASYFGLASSFTALADVQLKRIAAGQLGIQKDSTHGVTLDVSTDSTLKVFARDGSTPATVYIGPLFGYVGATIYSEAGITGGDGYMQLQGGNPRLYLSDLLLRRASATALRIGTTTGVEFNAGTDGVAWIKSFAGADTATIKANIANATGKYQINAVDGISCTSAGVVTTVFGIATVCSAPTSNMWESSGLHILTIADYNSLLNRVSFLEASIRK